MKASGTGIVTNSLVLAHTATTITLDTNTTGVASGAILSFTSMTTAFVENNTVTGSISGATGVAVRVLNNSINVSSVTGTFVINDVLTGLASATAKVQSTPVSQTLVTQYQHEFGYDKTIGQSTTPIESSFTSQNFGYAIGGPFEEVPKMVDCMTRILRLEPDMNQVGDIQCDVLGRSFAQDTESVINTYTLSPSDSFQNMGDQARIMKLRFTSNSLGGFYEQGQVQLSIEPGDERSTKQ